MTDWPQTITAARAAQAEATRNLRTDNGFSALETLETIAGVDVGYDVAASEAHAAVALLRLADLQPIETATARVPVAFPYVPGFLSFREIPAIAAALRQLSRAPDVLMVDGHGIAHPRRLGIAAHLGVLLDMPALGVAKSRLTGRHDLPGPARGDTAVLYDNAGAQIGTILRSKERTLPLFVSPGHRMDQAAALALTQHCLTRYRLPEPTRLADKLSKTSGQPRLI